TRGLVVRSRKRQSPVTAHRHAPDRTRMALEHTKTTVRVDVPQTHGSVVGSRKRAVLIDTPGHASHAAGVPLKGTLSRPVTHGPEPHAIVAGTREYALSVLTECVRIDLSRVIELHRVLLSMLASFVWHRHRTGPVRTERGQESRIFLCSVSGKPVE